MVNKVIIYSLPTCSYCDLAKEYFKANKIDYKEVGVDKDPVAQKEMIVKSGQFSVPVIDVNGQIVIGFQKNTLDALLLS
jgi:glutaredoxin-like YruB-family protein